MPRPRRGVGEPRRHMADGVPPKSALPMIRTQRIAAPRCENDSPSESRSVPAGIHTDAARYPQAPHRLFAAAARPGYAGRAALAVLGATPQPEGLVRVRG